LYGAFSHNAAFEFTKKDCPEQTWHSWKRRGSKDGWKTGKKVKIIKFDSF